jgi:hypothetical protein
MRVDRWLAPTSGRRENETATAPCDRLRIDPDSSSLARDGALTSFEKVRSTSSCATRLSAARASFATLGFSADTSFAPPSFSAHTSFALWRFSVLR